jgi:hypothetical protein
MFSRAIWYSQMPTLGMRAPNIVPLIMQTEGYDEDVHLPQFSKAAEVYGFEAYEAQDLEESAFNRFSRDALGNSSAQVSDNSDVPQGENTVVVTVDMSAVQDDEPIVTQPAKIVRVIVVMCVHCNLK